MTNANTLTWLGHGGWALAAGGTNILVDPFLEDCPTAPCPAADLEADCILVSHGHFDHVADVPAISLRTGAQVVANFEIATWLQKQHQVPDAVGMNLGGGIHLPWGHVKMTPAWHSSQLPDGSYGGNPCGFVVSLPGYRIYFACDTALFSDMKLIGDLGIDLAVLPIGDLFTMGPDDSIVATRFVRPRQVIPSHYNTWPPIQQDASAWADRIRAETGAEPVVLQPGQPFRLAGGRV